MHGAEEETIAPQPNSQEDDTDHLSVSEEETDPQLYLEEEETTPTIITTPIVEIKSETTQSKFIIG